MTILVTGAAGFIGAHVAKALLARGDRVIGIDNLNAYYDPALKRARIDELIGAQPGFRFVRADFADPVALAAAVSGEAVSAIIHLGAQAGVRHSIDAPRDYLHSNLAGQLELLELARRLGVGHLVYASSSSVYGDAAPLPFAVEAATDSPVSLYAATKKAGEMMAYSYAHLYRIPMTGLRFFTVYGPWGRPDMAVWRFADRLLRGEPLPLFNGGQMRRDFTYIDDIVAGVLAALDRPPSDAGTAAPHRLFNLGNDRPVELLALVAALGAAFGVEPVIDPQPMQPGDVAATWADIGPARAVLGYDPQTPFDVGVARFADWFRGWTAN